MALVTDRAWCERRINRSTTPASIVLVISQRFQIRIARQFFIDRIFKPGLLFSLSAWTRPTFDHSEVKIGLYSEINKILSIIATFTGLTGTCLE